LPPFPFTKKPALLDPGQAAPEFRLLDQRSHTVSLDDTLGESRALILLFFMSDFLPGDWQLLSAYAAVYPHLREANLNVAGISGINWETIYHLGRKLNVPFPLLFDPCCRISTRYQTMWLPKFINNRAMVVVSPQKEIILTSSKFISPDALIPQLV
jgi:thioredoxin-dependent peroxiredoxin